MLTSNPSSAIENVATETWSECLSHMDLTVQRNMMQTCKFFREMCLPLVFKKECVLLHVDPCIPNQEQDLRALMHSLALSKSSVHAPLVRKLTLSYNEDNFRAWEPTVADVKYLRSMFTNLCVKLFPRFTNLREVYIVSNRNIDKALLVALAELPDLTELGMGSAKFGMLDLSNGTRIRVRKLGIFNNVSDYDSKKAATVLDVFSGERLEDLTILSRVYSPKIMRSLTQQNNNALLKSIRLELDPKELKTLVAFLVSSPNLESLRVSLVKSSSRLRSSGVSVPEVLPRLPSSALPQLRSFSGVEELAKMIVPGRPVQHINVEARCRLWHSGKNNILDRRPEELNMLLARLAASIIPIKHLGLEDYVLENGLLDTIASHTPNISSVLLNLKQEIDMVGDSPDKGFISKDEVYFDDTIKHSQNLADQQSRFFLPSVQHLPYMVCILLP
ncbi:hypothetical protein JR316_0003875 [Psilocybe cubensis]|uniref:F-box domain-containing protein n=2 Tax=Psilocybe cubensis TaxID=181762 RepID=A0A8H7Y6E5_PSICU|nr:hypothetical protein JR316_0003875 [Psilocybe cubensis]KAH9484394.1 hypothetical protein JR316_0003875 [Psilocybe cubensis]